MIKEAGDHHRFSTTHLIRQKRRAVRREELNTGNLERIIGAALRRRNNQITLKNHRRGGRLCGAFFILDPELEPPNPGAVALYPEAAGLHEIAIRPPERPSRVIVRNSRGPHLAGDAVSERRGLRGPR
jgi:hypothetical protein